MIMIRRGLYLAFIMLSLLSATPIMAQDKPLPLEVGLGDVSLNKLMFVIAAETGIYKKNGLDVAQFISPSAAEVVRRSGVDVPKEFVRNVPGDINIGGGSPMMVAMTTNALAIDRVILATTDPVSRFHVVSRPDITRPEDLKGKRIGYSSYGALSHLSAINWAKKMGWDPDRDISLISNAMSVDVLKSGRIDALVGDETAWTMAINAGFRDLVDLGQYEVAMAGSGVNAAKSWLPTHRETAARFIKSTVEAGAFIKTNKPMALAAMKKWYGIADAAHQESIYAEAAKLASQTDPHPESIQA